MAIGEDGNEYLFENFRFCNILKFTFYDHKERTLEIPHAPKFWRKMALTYSAITRQQIEIKICLNPPKTRNCLYFRLKKLGSF